MSYEAMSNPNLLVDFNKDKPDILNKYSGTAVLCANGDSLNDVPFEFLSEYPTIGTNNVYLLGLSEEEVAEYPGVAGFTPNFYTILGIDQLNTEEKLSYCRPAIEGANLAFVNRLTYSYFDLPHVYAIHGVRASNGTRPYPKSTFTNDLMDYVGLGYTNTYIMFQILYWLGFNEVLCVGLDNDYGINPDKRHFYPDDPRFSCEPSMGRASHQKGSNYVFGLAKEAFEKDGRTVININKKNNTPLEGRLPEW
jgi:hypothetical protein